MHKTCTRNTPFKTYTLQLVLGTNRTSKADFQTKHSSVLLSVCFINQCRARKAGPPQQPHDSAHWWPPTRPCSREWKDTSLLVYSTWLRLCILDTGSLSFTLSSSSDLQMHPSGELREDSWNRSAPREKSFCLSFISDAVIKTPWQKVPWEKGFLQPAVQGHRHSLWKPSMSPR